MARSSLNQSIGNSIQIDRLPASRPTLEFPARPASAFETGIAVICWLIVLTGSGLGAWLLAGSRQSLPLPPFSIIGLFAAIVCGFAYEQRQSSVGCDVLEKISQKLNNSINSLGLLAVVSALLFLNAIPSFAFEMVAAFMIGTMVQHLGRHYVGRCTVSPMRRTRAWEIRRMTNRWLMVMWLWPLVGVLLDFYFHVGALLLTVTAIVCLVAAVAAAGNRPWHVVHAPFDAVLQWFVYNLQDVRVPGIYVGPCGPWMRRLATTAICSFLVTCAVASEFWKATEARLPAMNFTHTENRSVQRIDRESAFLLIISGPVGLSLGLPILLAWPALAYSSRRRENYGPAQAWSNIVADLRTSPDPIERDSIFIGRIYVDGSPVLLPRYVFNNHAHFLGDSGSGKTALGLAPWLEQMILRGDCSFVVLDMKGDSCEILAAMQEANRKLEKPMPLKTFTMMPGCSTREFNPMKQHGWRKLDPQIRADILCSAFGLNYGTDYGASWFTAVSKQLATLTISADPNATTFRELLVALDKVLSAKGARKLDSDLRSAGLHFRIVLQGLADLESLNTVHAPDSDVSMHSIDLGHLFREPEMAYFQLPSTMMPTVAPEIARLVVYSLLTEAGMHGTKRRQVYLVIDEFQRILSNNLESILQVARSLNVGVILANQSMQDLQSRGTDLIPALEANCRFRQWFGVSSSDDRARLVANSGETLEELEAVTTSSSSVSRTINQHVFPRIAQNDVILATDHPQHSILTLKNGAGYAQYGGFPVIMHSDFHISAEEYESRRQMAWPQSGVGTFVPMSWQVLDATANQIFGMASPSTPTITTEFFGSDPPIRGEHTGTADKLRRSSRRQNPEQKRRNNDRGTRQ